jgi:hypothetical protein
VTWVIWVAVGAVLAGLSVRADMRKSPERQLSYWGRRRPDRGRFVALDFGALFCVLVAGTSAASSSTPVWVVASVVGAAILIPFLTGVSLHNHRLKR